MTTETPSNETPSNETPSNETPPDQERSDEQIFVRAGPKPAVGHSAAFGWRWLFPLVTLACLIAVPVLARIGTKAVLDTEGTASLAEQVRNPESPGYRAFVTPSPTALVVIIDEADEAVGAALLASAGDSGGGTVVVLGANVMLPPARSDASAADADEADTDEAGNSEPATVAAAWKQGGSAELAGRSAELFGIVADQVFEARPSDIAVALGDIGPLTYSFVDPLVDVDDDGESLTLFARGVASLEPADVPIVLAALGPGEADVNRSDRHVQLWRSWISAARSSVVERGADAPGLDWFVSDLARSASNVVSLPAASDDGGETYSPLDDEVALLVEQSVPFPVLYRDNRPTVRLVNDIADPTLNRPAVETIAAVGGLVTVIGNPIELGGQATGIAYFDDADAAVAQRIADAFGGAPASLVDPTTQQDAILGGEFDIVVTIGSDYDPPVPGG